MITWTNLHACNWKFFHPFLIETIVDAICLCPCVIVVQNFLEFVIYLLGLEVASLFLFSFSFLLICCQIWNLFSIIIGSSLNFMQVDNKYNKFPIFMKILTLLHYNFLLPLEFIFTIVNLNIWHWFFSRHISSLRTLFIN